MLAVPLIASYWTLAGDVVPLQGSDVSPIPLAKRIAAAGDAGFRGIGLNQEDLAHAMARHGGGAIAAMLEEAGITVVELEMLGDWFADGDRRAASDAVRRELLGAAQELGARHIKCAGPSIGDEFPPDVVTAEFARLCDEAAAEGAAAALEPMPFMALRDLEAALAVVAGADRPNGGLCVDIWHMVRGDVPFAEVRELPPERVVAVEIGDAAAHCVGDLLEDTLHRRLLCGQGDFDLDGFVDAVRATGFDGPFGVEILSDEQRKLPLEEAARLAFETAAATVAASRRP